MIKKTQVPGDHGGQSMRRKVAWSSGACVDCCHVVVFWIDTVDYHVLCYLPLLCNCLPDGGLHYK